MLSVTITRFFLYIEMCTLQKSAKANDANFFYEKKELALVLINTTKLALDLIRHKNA